MFQVSFPRKSSSRYKTGNKQSRIPSAFSPRLAMRQLNNQPKKSRKQRNNFFQGAYFREMMPHITNGTAEKVKALSIILARLNSACPLSIRRQQSSNETALPQTRDTTISQTQKRNRNSGDVFGFKFICPPA